MAALRPVRFRIYNYRNIDDSGWIELAQVTALVGRNESGKTTLLKALHKFNPATPQPYVPQREFPRDRFIRDFQDAKDWDVCAVEFEIAQSLRQKFAADKPGFVSPATVTYTRRYDGSLTYLLDPWPTEADAPHEMVTAAVNRFKLVIMQLTPGAPEQAAAYQTIRTDLLTWLSRWADRFKSHGSLRSQAGQALLKALRDESNAKARTEVASALLAFQSELGAIAEQAEAPLVKTTIEAELRKHLPVFIYFDNYGILDSAIYLPRFLDDLARDPHNPKVRSIEAMFRHVGLTAREVADLGRSAAVQADRDEQPVTLEMIRRDQEKMELRRIKLNSASNDITRRFSAWWGQRRHTIRYDTDGEFFRVWVSDDKRPGIDIELESRSAGFQWFFSFYLVFLVESEAGHKDSVLLLDEPGLHLHPTAQQELIAFFEEISASNQLVYTTHSAFLIDAEHIDRVRAISEDDSGHSRVSNNGWPKDRDTIFPLQAAAGYAMVQGLFRNKNNILVEGMSEFFYLNALSVLCRAKGRTALAEDIFVTPCGGSKLVGTLASLFLGQDVRPLILLDADDAGRVRRSALMKELYLGNENAILMLDEVLDQADCEIEDLIGRSLFVPMASKVVGHTLALATTGERAGSLTNQVKAAAHQSRITLPDGWKPEIARRFAIEWSRTEAVPNDLLERAEHLFKTIEKRFTEMAAP